MSRQGMRVDEVREREVLIRRKDHAVEEAFQIALAFNGVRFLQTSQELPYLYITGNKSSGVVAVKTYANEGNVYFGVDNSDVWYTIKKVEITKLDGQILVEPKVVEFSNFGGQGMNLLGVLGTLTDHRNAVIYDLVKKFEGHQFASSLLHFLEKYPYVVVDRDGYRLVYHPQQLGVQEISIWYNRNHGYTQAIIIIDHVARFYIVPDWLKGEWEPAVKPDEDFAI